MITQQYGPLELGYTTQLYNSWNDRGSEADKNGSFWRPVSENLPGDWHCLGSMGRSDYNDIGAERAAWSPARPSRGRSVEAPDGLPADSAPTQVPVAE